MSDRRPAVAAIAVSHDSSHILPQWIEALEAVASREALELCVVDSGSSAAQLATMREQAAGRVDRFVALPNVGFGAACNAGAAATAAPTLLFGNPDTRFRSLPARALEGGGLGGDLLGGFAIDPDRPLGFARLPTFREEAGVLALGRWSQAFQRSPESPAWVSGAALMIDRGDFDHVGGFSPAFFMYFEDADLCARHRCAGGAVKLDPELVVDHAAGKSTDVDQLASIGGALDGVNRLSGRRFAARYGRPWDRAALYLLLALAYVPRRLLSTLLRREPLRPALDHCATLLRPSRALREVGARPLDVSPLGLVPGEDGSGA